MIESESRSLLPEDVAVGRRPLKSNLLGRLTRLPGISNNVGSVKLFLSALLDALRRVVLFVFFDFCIDDHGSFVIERSVSVRPIHLFDQNIDHDYFFKLPCRERDAQSSARRSTSRHVR
jgi:hypothetical protein